ncbi:FTR1 family iron permease [Azospira restricta]|uniref:FTR1 family protein n=1 Tax=Azospira restricta TaxID=404405 RepID=A0A974PXP5_9RHOO|nr:FTR1 family protein [Azospira restricta]QRJ63169.1 FTR1 family protein [Azospira restricta]
MGNAFFVVWRESLEAFLVVGILYAWLQANDDSGYGRGRRALFAGVAAGVALAAALGWALVGVQDELAGEALDAFQTGMLLVAAALITQMVLWMRKHGRQMRARLHAELASASERSGALGVAVVAALAVAREGAETVIFLYGLAQEGSLQPLFAGAAAGFVAAALTAWLAARGLKLLNLGLFLRISSLLLLVLASALLVAAADRMIGAGWLPALVDPLWDSSALLDDAAGAGKLVADFSGYRARPALSVVIAYAAYWAGVALVWRRAARG